ncbi:MAG TPA: hypothetical protein GXX36_03395 [Clostridiaceae bacterium]|nr:hypothetical protein [Clostridiaceae bacterium]
MAYNTTAIKKDVDGKPIPQYYNPIQDTYEALQGRNGASRVELYDADGNPIDLEALLTAIVTALGNVTVSNSALPTGAATATNQTTIRNIIDTIHTTLTQIKNTDGIKKITDPLPEGSNNIGKVTIAKSDMEYYGKSLSDRPAASSVPVGATFMIVGNLDVIYQSDGSQWVVIS